MKTVSILLGEDSKPDAIYTLKTLKLSSYNIYPHLLTNGLDVIEYLNAISDDPLLQFPDVIILDINMPIKTGLEVLLEIKKSPELRDIPVILLTVSKSEYHINLSKTLKADYYMVKPLDIEVFDAIIGQISKYKPTRYIRNA